MAGKVHAIGGLVELDQILASLSSAAAAATIPRRPLVIPMLLSLH
jgi:hypothetical protein